MADPEHWTNNFAITALIASRDKAEAEVERLREALERIDSTEFALPATVRRIARDALNA